MTSGFYQRAIASSQCTTADSTIPSGKAIPLSEQVRP